MEFTKAFFAAALKSLRQKLNEPSQEGMAHRIGCTMGAYSKWERAQRIPRGDWLLKAILLCRDAESLRDIFRIDCSKFKEPAKKVDETPQEPFLEPLPPAIPGRRTRTRK